MNMDDGKERLASFETIMREICGTIRPTQPILPAIATLLAVITVAQIMAIKRIRRVLTPSERASSSESESRLIFQARTRRTAKLTRSGTAISPSSPNPTPESEPMRKYVMAGSTLFGSATSFTKLVDAENRDEMTMPTRIRERVCSRLVLEARV